MKIAYRFRKKKRWNDEEVNIWGAVIRPIRRSMRELKKFIDSLPTQKGELIRVLHRAQGIFGYLPREVQVFVAREMEVPVSKVYGVVSFYSYFTMKPKGKYEISVCMGTACYVRGAESVLEELRKKLGIEPGETNGRRQVLPTFAALCRSLRPCAGHDGGR